MENSNYKGENIERKYLSNMRKNQLLKVENNILELQKDFIELKDRELKNREVKIKTEKEELFLKPIIVSIDDMDKFDEKKTKRVAGFKDKIVTLVNTNMLEQTLYGRGKKTSKPKT